MNPRPGRDFGLFAAAVTGLSLLVGLVGGSPTEAMAGATGRAAMSLGIAVSALGSLAGGLFLYAIGRRVEPAVASLGAMAFRLTALVAIALAIFLMKRPDPPAFLLWIGISHLLILPLDAGYAVRARRSL